MALNSTNIEVVRAHVYLSVYTLGNQPQVKLVTAAKATI